MTLSIKTRHWFRNIVVLILAVFAVIAALPKKARGQLGLDPCCAIISAGLDTISGLLKDVVATPLKSIQQIGQQASDFERDVVWPTSAINQARNVAVQAEQQFVQMRQFTQVGLESATLPASQRLEQSLLSRNPAAVDQIAADFSALYGTVTPVTDAPPQVRDLVDMTDAEAQAAMKRAIEIDALADLQLQAAEQINHQLQTAAPGSATILDAQSAAWVVRSHAYTQSAMAELIRVRSIDLANEAARLKFSTAHTGTLHTTGNQVLQTGVQ